MKKIKNVRVSVSKKPSVASDTLSRHASDPLSVSAPFSVELGKRLASVRGTASQKDFARSIDIHKNTLGKYERGERVPDAWVLSQLHAVYGVSPLWMLTGVRRESSAPLTNVDKELLARESRKGTLPLVPVLLAQIMRLTDAELRRRSIATSSDERSNLVLTVYGMITEHVNREDIAHHASLPDALVLRAVQLGIGLLWRGAPPA